MNVIKTSIEGVVIVEPKVFDDDRGYFYESYNADVFASLGLPTSFVQDNHSFSKHGVLRGLHVVTQPKPMGKLVRCTHGRVWDVAVDVRPGSPTFGKYEAVELSAENKKMFWLPPGIAHGFYVLEDAEVLYKCTNTYDKASDVSIAWNDPALAIAWPLAGEPTLSARDAAAPQLADLDLRF